MKKSRKNYNQEKVFKGLGVSPGIITGKTFIMDEEHIEARKGTIPANSVESEVANFKQAIEDTADDLRTIIDQVGMRVSSQKREIFDFNLMILEDPEPIKETIKQVRRQKINADFAYYVVMRKFQDRIMTSKDSYLRARFVDIRDIKRRVIKRIQGSQSFELKNLKNAVVIASELNFFDLFILIKYNIAGIILEKGGRTTHLTIMMRSLEVPSIIGASGISEEVTFGESLVANGITGDIVVAPSAATRKKYEKKQSDFRKFEKQYLKVSELPSQTMDGVSFEVNANIEFPEETGAVSAQGDFGVGLYRTEFSYMSSGKLPTEQEQFLEYEKVAKDIHPRHTTIRTIDLGGDKFAPFMETENEENPYLGWRAVRICLDMPELFRKQLRAILRASSKGNVKIMLPMIVTLHEVQLIKQMIAEEMLQLKKQRISFDNGIQLGVMIEVPAAVLISEALAKEVDFFSIGTNDLIQYTLAVDRGNEKVAHLYSFYHPAILKLIKMTVKAAKKQGIQVGMCGEMAGDPMSVILLLGMGITEFSVSPIMLLKIKQMLRSVKVAEAKKVAEKALKFSTVGEVEEYVKTMTYKYFPKLDDDNFFRNGKSNLKY